MHTIGASLTGALNAIVYGFTPNVRQAFVDLLVFKCGITWCEERMHRRQSAPLDELSTQHSPFDDHHRVQHDGSPSLSSAAGVGNPDGNVIITSSGHVLFHDQDQDNDNRHGNSSQKSHHQSQTNSNQLSNQRLSLDLDDPSLDWLIYLIMIEI